MDGREVVAWRVQGKDYAWLWCCAHVDLNEARSGTAVPLFELPAGSERLDEECPGCGKEWP